MNHLRILAIAFFLISVFSVLGCIDDDPVKYNVYAVMTITTPVDRQGSASEKKVHIGHDMPVNVTLTAAYAEVNVPIQFYMLHVDDVDEVENGIGLVSDIRMYFCERTPNTTIDLLQPGTHTYGLIVNIPSEDSKDELTGDFKTGEFYIVAEVNKFEDAELDAYAVYQKFRGSLGDDNKIVITSDYMKKPDLSVENMHFTGSEDEPNDVLVWYNVSLENLPGIENSSLSEEQRVIIIEPSMTDRTFTGTVEVRSSASDALNVPIVFWITNDASDIGNSDGDVDVLLDIYDKSMGGYVDKYYIPILKANTTERITLGLRIPEEHGDINYFSDYEAWPADPDTACGDSGCSPGDSYTDCYPLSAIRHALGKKEYGDHTFHIVAEVNPGGEVTETRFITSHANNDEYTENDYYESGDVYDTGNTSPSITKDNNEKSEGITFTLEEIEVEPNEGIKAYPYCKLDPPDEDYRSLVIFWDGFALSVGGSKFGASAEMHEGMFFYNYSLYSLGVDVHGTVFNNSLYLINTYLNAESHPFEELRSGFEFHVEGGQKVVLSEAGSGFSANTWEYPILLWSKEKSMEKWVYCFKFKLTAGVETWLTPGVNLNINVDGSLVVDKYANLRASVYADASASIAGLATVGLYTYIDVLTLELIQSCYTTTQYDEVNWPGRVKGTLNRDVGLYLVGPKGYLDIYFEIDFIFFSKRWSKQLFSFSSFRVPLLEVDFAGSGEYTNWMRVHDAGLIDYSVPQ